MSSPSDATDPLTPDALAELFPQLEILELLGEDAQGAVYKARQPRLNRLVVLRVLPAHFGRDPALIERLSREGCRLCRLDHPGLAAVHEVGVDGACYVLTDFIEGTSLRQLLARGPLDQVQALAIVTQLCEALQYLSGQELAPGDIQPENIFVDKKGRAKVADWWLSALLRRAGAPPAAERRVALRSLGRVMYEMLAGEAPADRFVPPSHKAQLDPQWDDVVRRCLGTEPHGAYQDAAALKGDLEQLAARYKKRPAARATVPARRRSRPFALFAALALVAAVYGYLVVPAVRESWPVLNWRRWQTPRSRPPRNFTRFSTAVRRPLPFGTLTANGPVLNAGDGARLALPAEQLLLANAILRVSFREYVELERRHWTHKRNEAGHLVTTIAPFAADFEQFENHFWSKLDGILNEQQQSRAREILPIRTSAEIEGAEPSYQVAPRFFGWAGEGATIETWHEAGDYYWTISVRGHEHTQSGAEMPAELARFWEEAGEPPIETGQ